MPAGARLADCGHSRCLPSRLYDLYPRQITLASLIIVMAGLLLALPLKLLPSLLAGLLVFELVNMLTPRLQPLLAGQRARWLAVALLGTLVVSTLTLLIAGAFSFLLHEAENPGASLDKFMALVERARGQLPPFIEGYLPASAAEFKVAIGDWIKSHLSDLQLVGKGMAHMFVTLLIGMILGAIIALQRIPDVSRRKPGGGAVRAPQSPGEGVSQHRLRADQDLAAQHGFHRHLPGGGDAAVRRAPAADQDADRADLPAGLAAGDRQLDV